MKKKLLLIAACAMALNAPVQAATHKTKTIASSVVAVLGAIGMGITGKYWHDNAQKLENANLSAAQRQELNNALSNYKALFAASSVATVGAAAYAIGEGLAWKKENKQIKKNLKLFPKNKRKLHKKDRKALIKKLKRNLKKLNQVKQFFGDRQPKLWYKDKLRDMDSYKKAKRNIQKFKKYALLKKPLKRLLNKDFENIRDDEWLMLIHTNAFINDDNAPEDMDIVDHIFEDFLENGYAF